MPPATISQDGTGKKQKGVIRRTSYLNEKGLAPDEAVAVRMAAAPRNPYGSGRDNAKARKGVVRVEDYVTTTAIRSRGDHGCEFVMLYKEDPRGYIPAFVFNWAAKVAIPSSLKLMQSAMDHYAEYTHRQKEMDSAHRTPWEQMLNPQKNSPYVQLQSPPKTRINGSTHGSVGHVEPPAAELNHRLSAPEFRRGFTEQGGTQSPSVTNQDDNGGSTTFAGSSRSFLSTMTAPPAPDGVEGMQASKANAKFCGASGLCLLVWNFNAFVH
jgi:hypothetical protein